MVPSLHRYCGFLLALLLVVLVPASPSLPALQSRRQSAGQEDRPPAGLFFPRTIIVVRHAEKGADDPRDPSLSEEGRLRAEALSRLLAKSGVTHLFASEFKRTGQTLEPLSRSSGATIRIVAARDPEALLTVLGDLPRGSVAVVAGHSNTVPGLVERLAPDSDLVGTAPGTLALTEADHDRLYVITQWAYEKGANLLELRY